MVEQFYQYSDPDRIKDAVDTLAAMTEPDRPFTRLVFSAEYKAARVWLHSKFEGVGLECRTDAGGNLIGTRKAASIGEAPRKVIIGSHIDTVAAGGRFDGIAGVIAGLETVHYLNQNNINLPFDIEIIDFLGEELNVWGTSCLGSRHMAGLLTDDLLARNDQDGRQLSDEINKVGGTGIAAAMPRQDAGSIIACLELHIEQSSRLEREGIDIGVVTDIPGISRYAITVTGSAGHSGTTRMQERKDALVTASHIVTTIRDLALEISSQDNRHFVATIGRIEVYPNGAAIIPGQVSMILDLRASNAQSRDRFLSNLQAACTEISHREICDIGMDPISAASVALMDDNLRTHLANSSEELGLNHISIASGAGHDMAHMSRIAPAAMIFIPCKDGLSHCPDEFATPEAIARGSAVLTHTVLKLAGGDI
ncbi:Zn-dependent hydrolase [SAR116 cluster bacterium]|nr:Zn-dependent hydrolase [SAR116 cluster bacterium]